MGGSVVSLDKAFDNPMYGQQMASTSSGGSMETVSNYIWSLLFGRNAFNDYLVQVQEAGELKENQPKGVFESEFANPLYDESKIIVDDIED